MLTVALLLSPVLGSSVQAQTEKVLWDSSKTYEEKYEEKKVVKTVLEEEPLDPAIAPHLLMVRFHPEALDLKKQDKYTKASLQAFLDRHALTLVDIMNTYNIALVSDSTLHTNSAFIHKINSLETEKIVDYAEPNRFFSLSNVDACEGRNRDNCFVAVAPAAQQEEDPELRTQWHLYDGVIGEENIEIGNDIGATYAWHLQDHARDVVVAVLDTGVDYTHADLQGNMWNGFQECYSHQLDRNGNLQLMPAIAGVQEEGSCLHHGYGFQVDVVEGGVNEDGIPLANQYNISFEPNTMDTDGHGTHIAGIIGAESENPFFGRGIAGEVQLMAVQIAREHNMNVRVGGVFDPSGAERQQNGWNLLSSVVQGIAFAQHNGADIINLSLTVEQSVDSSLGDTLGFRTLRLAIQEFVNQGGVVVSAAGQEGALAAQQLPAPCRFAETICVTATDHNDIWMNLANIGQRFSLNETTTYPGVDIAAPGQDIWSTGLNNTFVSMSGTSMAAAQVSGAAALILAHQQDPFNGSRLGSIRSILEENGDDVLPRNSFLNDILLARQFPVLESFSRVNVHKALCAIAGERLYNTYCLGLQDTDMIDGAYHCEGVWQAVGPGVRNCFKLGVRNNRSVLLNVSSFIPTPSSTVSSTPVGNASSTPDVEPSFVDAVGMLTQSMLPLQDGVAYDLNVSYQSSEHGEFEVYLLHKVTGEKTALTYMPVADEEMLDGMTLPASEVRRTHRYRFETPAGMRALYDLVFVANGEDYYRTVYRNGEDLDEAVVSFQLHHASITEVE